MLARKALSISLRLVVKISILPPLPGRATPLKYLSCLTLLLFWLLAGCVSATGGVATSNVPIQGRSYEVLGPAETTVSWMTFNIGILGFSLHEPPVDRAEQRLLQEKGGDALINLRYWNDQSVIFFITYQRFHLKADVIRFKKAPPAEKKRPKARKRRRR